MKLKGTIEEVKLVPAANEGTHVMLKTGTETILVHVAPPGILEGVRSAPWRKGIRCQVIGSKLTIDGQDEVLAKEITKGDNSVTLRDHKGVPVWQSSPAKK